VLETAAGIPTTSCAGVPDIPGGEENVQIQDHHEVIPEAPAPAVPPPVAGSVPIAVPASTPEPHSRLGQLTVSLSVLAIGVLGIVDLSGVDVAASAYFALPLTVVGAGLLAGAWFGRSRWMIVIGVVLSVTLGIATTAEGLDSAQSTVTWRPTTLAQLNSTYKIDAGNAVLDLSTVELSGADKAVEVNVGVGNLTIIVAPDADVRAEATVNIGNADVFGTHWAGASQSTRTITDDGADGPGNGELVIHATVGVGNLEVRR
jgi:hypothetical protein